eukprot:gene12846-biopygen9491
MEEGRDARAPHHHPKGGGVGWLECGNPTLVGGMADGLCGGAAPPPTAPRPAAAPPPPTRAKRLSLARRPAAAARRRRHSPAPAAARAAAARRCFSFSALVSSTASWSSPQEGPRRPRARDAQLKSIPSGGSLGRAPREGPSGGQRPRYGAGRGGTARGPDEPSALCGIRWRAQHPPHGGKGERGCGRVKDAEGCCRGGARRTDEERAKDIPIHLQNSSVLWHAWHPPGPLPAALQHCSYRV